MPESVDTVEYNGFNVVIHFDEAAENPWESWDCNPPIIVNTCERFARDFTTYGDVDNYIPDLTRAEIVENLDDIRLALGYGKGSVMIRKLTYDGVDDTVDAINQAIADNDISLSDRLKTIEWVYGIKGVPCLLGSVHGYSQGDYAEVLVVLTEEWRKEAGILEREDILSGIMTGAIELYGAWAWGDVYYAVIEEDGEELDSCCGFYGHDHEKSGLMDYARYAIDWEVDKRRKARLAHTKAMIKHKVPLLAR